MEKTDIVYDKIVHFKDVSKDEQALACGYVYEHTFLNGEKAMLPNTPVHFLNKRDTIRRAPFLGEDSRSILQELGYTQENIENLISDGIVKAR